MKITIEARAECGYPIAERREIIDFVIEDGLTDDKIKEIIDEEVREWFFEHNSWSWERVDDV